MPENTQIIPCGGWYIDTTTLQFQGKVLKAIGGESGAYLPLTGGTMGANAVIEGTDTLEISLTDNDNSSVFGLSPEGASIINNQNSEVSSSVRAIQDAVEIKANDTTVTVNGTGVSFGGAALSNVASIGNSSATEIAFESNMDMNNHTITGLPTSAVTDATNADDVITQLNALLAQLRLAGIIPNA